MVGVALGQKSSVLQSVLAAARKSLQVNRFPRVLAQEYSEELAKELRSLHEAVLALVEARLKPVWKIRYGEVFIEGGEVFVEVSLADFVQRLREVAAEFFEDNWVLKLVRRMTSAAIKAAERNFQTELRRALGGRHPGGEIFLPRGNLGGILEARVMAQVQEIKSIPEKYVVAVTRLIADSAVNGVPYSDLAEDLRELVGMAEDRARMIAVTELGKVYNEAAFDRYGQLGVEHVIWVTADDERTCEECAPLDGERMTVGQAHDKLPVHPNCRCTVIADPEELREAGG